MKSKTKNSLTWLEFPHLAEYPELMHAIFTRNNGCSPPPFDSLNVGLHVGDKIEFILRNRTAIISCFGTQELIEINQVHGDHILTIHQPAIPDQVVIPGPMFQGDAVITNATGKLLLIQVADCQPILLFDPIKQVVANIHSGWKGSLLNIIQQTITVMKEKFGCRPDHLLAGIGPSLGPCCAEFIHYRDEIPEQFWCYKNDRHYFDFWAISQDQLISAGVLSEHIQISELCTRCRSDLFFSYRRQKITGRFAAVIGLKSP